ncbi:MAG: hypothetical protein PHW43_11260 [Syntrophales bacterium]|nr:hypothetical protein [Syntrophales bacterium]
MRGISCFFVILSITIVITGCAYHGSTVETGKPINEGYVSRIEKGKSTGADILAWFGAPT